MCIDSDTKTYDSFACTQIASLYGGVQNRNGMAGRQKSSHGCGYFVERIRSKNVPDREVGRAGGGKWPEGLETSAAGVRGAKEEATSRL